MSSFKLDNTAEHTVSSLTELPGGKALARGGCNRQTHTNGQK